jgi:hypothetical protein
VLDNVSTFGRKAREREVVAGLARTTFQRFAVMLCEARLRFDVSRRLAPISVRKGHSSSAPKSWVGVGLLSPTRVPTLVMNTQVAYPVRDAS